MGSVVLALTLAAPAGASTNGGIEWLESVPKFPAQVEEREGALTPSDIAALSRYNQEFPWEEAFSAVGCEISNLEVDDAGGVSLLAECADASIPLDDVSKVPDWAAAAAAGEPAAAAMFADPSRETALAATASNASVELAAPQALSAVQCATKGTRYHCLENDSSAHQATSAIRTTSGSSTGKNRLGKVGFGNPCANGTLMKESVSLTITTTSISLARSAISENTQLSSTWTPSSGSLSRYCANI